MPKHSTFQYICVQKSIVSCIKYYVNTVYYFRTRTVMVSSGVPSMCQPTVLYLPTIQEKYLR